MRLILVLVPSGAELKWHMVDGIQLALLYLMARSLLYRDGMNMDATISYQSFMTLLQSRGKSSLPLVVQATYCVGSCATAYYPEAGSPCYGPGVIPPLSLYPRMHLMPSGLIASVGSGLMIGLYDPNTGKWLWSGKICRDIMGHQFYCL